MSRALFANIPAHGHVNPTLPLVAELRARGEDVDYALPPEYAAAVAHAGARHVPYSSLQPVAASAPALAAMVRRGAQAHYEDGPTFSELLVREATHTMPQLLEAVAQAPPDYVLHDPFCIAGKLLAERLGVPRIQLHPTYAFRRDSLEHPAFRRLAEWVSAWPASPRFDAAAQELSDRFGVPPPRMSDLFVGAADLNIVFVPRAFQPDGDAFDDRWVFVGPCVGARLPAAAGPQEPSGDGPLLLVSLGTVFNDRLSFFRSCLDAFDGSRWRLVVSVGNDVDLDALGPVPPNAVVARHVDQVALLERASVFLTHGGMNSAMEAILAGVPLVAMPQQPEQAVTADRLAELGLGVTLEADVTPAQLLEAVERVASDGGVRTCLAAMRASALADGGAPRAADAVLSHVR
jgi:MGT family glycosyltransferase